MCNFSIYFESLLYSWYTFDLHQLLVDYNLLSYLWFTFKHEYHSCWDLLKIEFEVLSSIRVFVLPLPRHMQSSFVKSSLEVFSFCLIGVGIFLFKSKWNFLFFDFSSEANILVLIARLYRQFIIFWISLAFEVNALK